MTIVLGSVMIQLLKLIIPAQKIYLKRNPEFISGSILQGKMLK